MQTNLVQSHKSSKGIPRYQYGSSTCLITFLFATLFVGFASADFLSYICPPEFLGKFCMCIRQTDAECLNGEYYYVDKNIYCSSSGDVAQAGYESVSRGRGWPSWLIATVAVVAISVVAAVAALFWFAGPSVKEFITGQPSQRFSSFAPNSVPSSGGSRQVSQRSGLSGGPRFTAITTASPKESSTSSSKRSSRASSRASGASGMSGSTAVTHASSAPTMATGKTTK